MKKFKSIKTNNLLTLFVLVFFSTSLTGQISDPKPLDPYITGQIMQQKILDKNLENVASDMTDIELWSNTIYTDSLLEIVYQPDNMSGDLIEGNLIYDINSPQFIAAKNKVIDLVRTNNTSTPGIVNILYEDDDDPVLILKVDSYETVYALRNSKNVHLIAAGGLMHEKYERDLRKGINSLPTINESYLNGLQEGIDSKRINPIIGILKWIIDAIEFGCGNSATDEEDIRLEFDNYDSDIDGEEPILRVPWNYKEMDILKANRCAAGAGVKVAMLDTGVSEDQNRLGDDFNATFPSREIIKETAYANGSTDDDCGHGTHMAGVIAGPKYDSAVRGVAYEADLVSIKSNQDVLLLSLPSILNLKQSMKIIRKGWHGTSGTKIMSMSLGYLKYRPLIEWELKKLDQKGILMFAAIGTSPKKYDGWVKKIQVYPAKNHRTLGVSGVFREDFFPTYEFCEQCHYGNKVDFIVPMQHSYSTKTHSLMEQGPAPSKVGGSSIATATMAGVAAIVWGLPENVNKSADEITSILINASTYPNRLGNYGFGVVDVAVATGCTAPDPEVVFELENGDGQPASVFSICDDIFLNSSGSIADPEGHFLRVKSVVNGEPTTILVSTSWAPPYPGTLPLLNFKEIIENEEENFSFTPGQTYEITFGIKDATFGWHFAYKQFTIQQAPISEVLPFDGSHTYNYGLESHRLITSFDINEGGTLRVNDLGATGYLPGSGQDATTNPFHADLMTYCGVPQVVNVNEGGRFILGNDASVGGNKKAIVRIREENTVQVKAGGILRLARGSQLIVEQGAKLIIDDGARIDLWWEDSSIHIQEGGELIINGAFKFIGSGFFQFDKDNILTLNSDFILHGSDSRFIQLNKQAKLNIGDHYLELQDGKVVYGTDSQIKIENGGSAFAKNVNFYAEPDILGGVGFFTEGASEFDFHHCEFNNLYVGIYAESGLVDQTYRVAFSEFNNCGTGVWTMNHSEFLSFQSSFHGGDNCVNAIQAENTGYVGIVGGVFEGFNLVTSPSVGAIMLKNVPSTSMVGVDILSNYIGAILENVPDANLWGVDFVDNEIGTLLMDVTEFKMGDCEVTNSSQYGIYVPGSTFQAPNNYSNIFLRSGTVFEDNYIGVSVVKGGLADNNEYYGRVLMDCAKMIHNRIGIEGQDVTLEIDALVHCGCENNPEDALSNTFIKNWTNTNPEDFFDICYIQLQVPEVLARANYWEGGTTAGTDYTLRYPNSSGNCQGTNFVPLNIDNAVSVEPTDCEYDGPQLPNPGDDTTRGQGVENPQVLSSLTVTPNPATKEVNITFGGVAFELEIFNPNGQRVYHNKQATNAFLDLSDWNKSVYIIKVTKEGMEVPETTKLVVQ